MIAYRASFCDPAGARKRALVFAESARDVRAAIRKRGGLPMAVSRTKRAGLVSANAKISSEVAVSSLDQLAMLLDAGVPLDQALAEVIHECPDDRAKAMFAAIHVQLCSNGLVAEAFARFPRQFPPHIQQLLRAGQQSGRLPNAFREVANYWTETDEIRAIIKRASTYPAIALSVVGAVVCFLLGYVLPLFDRVFKDLGVGLPKLTGFLIHASRVFGENWPVGVGLAVACSIAAAVGTRSERALVVRDHLFALMPGPRGIIQALATSRVAGLLGAMQRAGLPIQDAMQLCLQGTGNRWYDAAMARAISVLRSGKTLSESLDRAGIFPPTAIATLRIGEQSGGLERALAQTRAHFARMAAERVQRLLQWLEPLLTIGLGLCVGTVAVSLFHPLVMLAINIKR